MANTRKMRRAVTPELTRERDGRTRGPGQVRQALERLKPPRGAGRADDANG